MTRMTPPEQNAVTLGDSHIFLFILTIEYLPGLKLFSFILVNNPHIEQKISITLNRILAFLLYQALNFDSLAQLCPCHKSFHLYENEYLRITLLNCKILKFHIEHILHTFL